LALRRVLRAKGMAGIGCLLVAITEAIQRFFITASFPRRVGIILLFPAPKLAPVLDHVLTSGLESSKNFRDTAAGQPDSGRVRPNH
jgi:hypothetical protein